MSRKDERKKKDAGKRQRILTYVCAALIALVVLLSAYIAFSLRESQRAQEQGEAYRELYYASQMWIRDRIDADQRDLPRGLHDAEQGGG